MYDFIYDQQDIYYYYNEQFEEKIKCFDYTIQVRQPSAPYASALESFDDILLEFCDEKDMQSLANLRWYIFPSTLENDDNKYKMMVDDESNTIFSTNFTETLSAKLLEEHHNSNNVLSIINSIVLAMTFFCKHSYLYIMKLQNEDHLYIDCYIKKYKAYVEAAIYLNELLENLNVLVNYLYETIYTDYPKNPKFSIYRLMLIMWNREVLTPLTDLKTETNMLNVTLKIFKQNLIMEINKLYGYDIRINRSKPEVLDLDAVKLESKFEKEIDIDLIAIDSDFKVYNSNLFYNNQMPYELGSQYPICINESKNSIMEDIYSFDFQANYFLEQMPILFLDSICNEYSIFYFNDSQFPVSHIYQIFENNIISIIETFSRTYFSKINKLILIRYFKTHNFMNNKIINRTKVRIIDTISNIIRNQCEEEIILIFKDYLQNNYFTEKDAEMYLKAFDYDQDKSSKNILFNLDPLFLNLFKISKETIENPIMCEYASLYYFRELTKGRNHLYQTIEEINTWLDEEKEFVALTDKYVRKENKRRNIYLDSDVYQDQLFNFNPNLSFHHILEIFGIQTHSNMKMSSKLNDIMTDINVEEMATFPQTFDNFLGSNMEIEIDTSSLGLTRKI